jgi:RNA polymerase sigma-70 factor (ECF subfamily)
MEAARKMNTRSAEDLLAAAAAGDRAAFAQLYRQTAGQLLGLAQRMLQNRAASEEVIQEAFIRIWSRAGEFSPERGAAMAWMVTIVRNGAIDRLRRERGAVPLDSVPEREAWKDPGADPLALTIMSAEARALRSCLDQLDEAPRRAIMLAYWHGLTHEELAARIDAPLGTVKSWIRRGLARLKGCLEP